MAKKNKKTPAFTGEFSTHNNYLYPSLYPSHKELKFLLVFCEMDNLVVIH